MSPGYYRKLLLREWEKLAGNFLKQNNSKQNKGTSFMRGTFFLYSKSDRREGKSMNNMACVQGWPGFPGRGGVLG